jgi:vitamin K-dependent gamma-carboxylase-like protein
MRRLEAWLFAPGDPRRLAAVRIGLCGLLAARLATGPYLELAAQPAALFRPISFLAPLDRMPPAGLVAVVQALALTAAVLAAVGLWTRATLPLAWVAALPLVAMTSSLGKVVHNDVLLLLCLVPLLPAPAGAAWSLDARRRRGAADRGAASGWPVRTAMVVVAGAYFFSGLAKLLHAGPAWVASDNLRWVLYASSDQQPAPNPFALFVADRPVLAHLVAAATLAVELGFPLVLWRPRLAWLFVPAVVAMHAGIGLAMRLDYSTMAATVLVVLVDWPALADRLSRSNAAGAGGARAAPVPAPARERR